MSPFQTPKSRSAAGWPIGLLAAMFSLLASLIGSFAIRTLSAQTSQEISSHDVEPTFKLQAERNLVTVRVVVRDAKGAVVDNLRKDDFQIFDHGKLQNILNFSLQKAVVKTNEPAAKPAEKSAPQPEDEETTAPAAGARRFLALYFDDVNTPFENLARARDAADHFVTRSVTPGDRVALFTASGQKQIDFTADLAAVHQALFELRPRPIVPDDTSCGTIPAYEAYLIVDHNDPQAITVAAAEIIVCLGCDPTNAQCQQQAQSMAPAYAMRSLSFSETQSTAILRGIESIVRRMTSLPGQRTMVIVSGGFLTETLRFQLDQITDRALRSGVILNAIDARGLYTDPVTSDITLSPQNTLADPAIFTLKSDMIRDGFRLQADAMRDLAHDTGGIFFENNNDLDAGFQKTVGAPQTFYVLAFSPQNLKHDGAFHPLKVALVSGRRLSVQARRGYFAPKKSEDVTSQEKEEIREALFSQDETHELPIDVHTQYFMKSQTDARITVLTHIDLHPLHFRKEVDRNVNKLTFVTAVFDQDGHEINAQEKVVELRMLDSTLERFLQTGITMRNSFDVKSGTYVVRSVVRDADSGNISGLNRTVEIPY